MISFARGVLDYESRDYPECLKSIRNPPKKIYFCGNYNQEFFENAIAIVGTRQMSTYGQQVLESLFNNINRDYITIISGFMYGIDTYAHKLAVEHKIRTVGVLPCGPNIVHPEENTSIYDRMLNSNNFFISEFPFDMLPKIWTYPKRNRIIAGLSKITIVIEATINSGSLITAKFAHKFGKKVFAIPGDITRKTSMGCLQLIKEFAIPLIDTTDINKCIYDNLQISSYSNLFNILSKNPLTRDQIAKVLNMTIYECNPLLSELIFNGQVKEIGGFFYAVGN